MTWFQFQFESKKNVKSRETETSVKDIIVNLKKKILSSKRAFQSSLTLIHSF